MNTNTGAQSRIGVGIESTEGVPVKAQKLLDRVSGNLTLTKPQLRRRALRGVASSIGAVGGVSRVAGTVVVEPTPEGMPKLLCSFLGAPTVNTTTNSSITGNPNAVQGSAATFGATGTDAPTSYGLGNTGIDIINSTGQVVASTVYGNTVGLNSWVVTDSGVAGSSTRFSVTPPAGLASSNNYKVRSFAGPASALFDVGPGTAGPSRSLVLWSDVLGASAQLPVTLTELRGTSRYVFPGARSGALELRIDKTQTDPVQLSMDMLAMNQFMVADDATMGHDTAGYDILNTYAAAFCQLQIAGQITADARSFDIRLNKNVNPRDVLNGYMGPNGHYVQGSDHSGTATLFFSTEDELKRFMGNASSVAAPYGAKKNIIFVPMLASLFGDTNASGYNNRLFFNLPSVAYEAVTEPVTGPDAIMQEIRFLAYNDTVTGTGAQIGVENSMALNAITNVGVAMPVVPANDVQPLVV